MLGQLTHCGAIEFEFKLQTTSKKVNDCVFVMKGLQMPVDIQSYCAPLHYCRVLSNAASHSLKNPHSSRALLQTSTPLSEEILDLVHFLRASLC